MNKRQTKRMKRNAAKAPRWLRDGAAAVFDPQGARAHRTAKLGTFGAASEVRHIDPAEYKPAGAA
ncbi:hypothetical protein [Mesorhizobium sp. B2-5-11]|uniref:hypothetical protein n=1 Tax=Mesorhizobium sp. B2-5-11 TaxID=2589919 RepID=UPI00112E57BD|nr:hypothetical protein [Mesorhizobium sp. B2-5-11]TPK14141.1 hypothetical protein FJ490_02120 [Mesorhizobium sp. B2-5-11]